MTSKKILIILSIGIILFPSIILAQNENQQVQQKIKNFCSQFSTFTSKIDQKIIGVSDKLSLKRDEISNKIDEKRENREVKLEQVREKWDNNRLEHFAKLEEKAQTSEQKQAVADFEKAVNDAIVARRTAIDLAIHNFKTGVDQANASRKAAIDLLKNIYDVSVKTALTKAMVDCESGVAPATVRQSLVNDIKSARDGFNSERKEIDKIKDAKEKLISEKKAAFEKAISDFKLAMEKARSDFKASFPDKATTTED
jgi:hypothetical protein